jgi:hypothetical protein
MCLDREVAGATAHGPTHEPLCDAQQRRRTRNERKTFLVNERVRRGVKAHEAARGPQGAGRGVLASQ